jgi:hypothetical protein
MLFEIIFGPEAAESFRRLEAHIRSEVRDAIEGHLRHEVHVLALMTKARAVAWLSERGIPE